MRVLATQKRLAILIAAAGLSAPAMATNGYFSHGYGMKAKGMAGAATASASDAFGGANNPAAMVFAGDRMDLGLDWFSPKRTAQRSGSGGGIFDGTVESGSNNFYIPEFGYNRMLGSNMSVGLTVYGNGGMNTDYPNAPNDSNACAALPPPGPRTSNLLCGNTRLGVDLMQLVIAPTFAMKVNDAHSFGISPLFGYQRFKLEGLQAFDGAASSSPGNVTNRGYDSAHGFGVRIGWMGQVASSVTLGAAYSTKIRMSRFDKYKGLFAEQGDFDMPENYSVGLSWQATPAVRIALDHQVINHGKIVSVGNPSNNPGLLGQTNGAGFGWGNVAVTKLGVEYQVSKDLSLRAGYSWGKNPIQSRDVMFNILAPGVIQNHATLGMSYAVGGGELTVAYMHAFSNSVSGADGLGAGGIDTIRMHQNSLGIGYGWKFR